MPEPITTGLIIFAAVSSLAGETLKNCIVNPVSGAINATLGEFGQKQIDQIAGHWSLPENEHVQKALIDAQFKALANTVVEFRKWCDLDDQTSLDKVETGLIAKLEKFAKSGRKNLESHLAKRQVAERLREAFEAVLAGVSEPGARGHVIIKEVQQVFLVEIASAAGFLDHEGLPERFVRFYNGEYDRFAGWHARFVHFSHDALKKDDNFRRIFEAEMLARLTAGQTMIIDVIRDDGDKTRLFAKKIHKEISSKLDDNIKEYNKRMYDLLEENEYLKQRNRELESENFSLLEKMKLIKILSEYRSGANDEKR